MSHDWVVECCRRNRVIEKGTFVLPSGWSIIDNRFKHPSIGRGIDQRKSATPLAKRTIILTSQQDDFVEFWSRVAKFMGSKIRIVKSVKDLTASTQGFILMDDEFPIEYQAQAERFHIPVVSTVWLVQTLIHGKICDPSAHPKLTQLYDDDSF